VRGGGGGGGRQGVCVVKGVIDAGQRMQGVHIDAADCLIASSRRAKVQWEGKHRFVSRVCSTSVSLKSRAPMCHSFPPPPLQVPSL
jgi:hypothetical protein